MDEMREARYVNHKGELLLLPHIRVNREGRVQFLSRRYGIKVPKWIDISISYTNTNHMSIIKHRANKVMTVYKYGKLIYHTFNDCSLTFRQRVEHINGDVSDGRLENLEEGEDTRDCDGYEWLKYTQIVL